MGLTHDMLLDKQPGAVTVQSVADLHSLLVSRFLTVTVEFKLSHYLKECHISGTWTSTRRTCTGHQQSLQFKPLKM